MCVATVPEKSALVVATAVIVAAVSASVVVPAIAVTGPVSVSVVDPVIVVSTPVSPRAAVAVTSTAAKPVSVKALYASPVEVRVVAAPVSNSDVDHVTVVSTAESDSTAELVRQSQCASSRVQCGHSTSQHQCCASGDGRVNSRT